MFCENCGATLEEDALFCEKCGAKTEAGEASASVSESTNHLPNEPVYHIAPVMSVAPTMTVPPMAAPSIKPPMSQKRKILLFEIIFFFILCFALYKIGENKYGPQAIAEQYFQAEAAGDWNAMYDMLDLPSSPLLTKEFFCKSMETTEPKVVTNYAIKEEMQLSPLETSDYLKNFSCEYMIAGDAAKKSEDISLVKGKEKKLFLFDDWKVSRGNNLVKDFEISIPKDATATLNDVNIEDLAKRVDEEEYSNQKTYILSDAFPGDCILVVRAPYREDYVEVVNIDNYRGMSVASMTLQEGILDEIAPICESFIEKLNASAIKDVSYNDFCNEIEDFVTEDFEGENYYENLLYTFCQNEYEYYTSVSIDQISYELNGNGGAGDNGNLEVLVAMDYSYEYSGYTVETDWWTGEVTGERPTDGNWENMDVIYFELVDGNWKITAIN